VIETIDPRPVEGIRATGAHKLVEVLYGVVPQVLPLWLSFTLYRFESNVRSASVVGIAGAGGIGVVLFEVIRSFHYAQMSDHPRRIRLLIEFARSALTAALWRGVAREAGTKHLFQDFVGARVLDDIRNGRKPLVKSRARGDIRV
jgi:hypothetical protein